MVVNTASTSDGFVCDVTTTTSDGTAPPTKTDPAQIKGVQPGQQEVVVPKIDSWGYRSLKLPNGLSALLVSDDNADMAAAAMDVRFPRNAIAPASTSWMN